MWFESLLPRVSAAKPQESQELSQSLCNDNSNYSLFFLKLVQAGFPPYLEPRVTVVKPTTQQVP